MVKRKIASYLSFKCTLKFFIPLIPTSAHVPKRGWVYAGTKQWGGKMKTQSWELGELMRTWSLSFEQLMTYTRLQEEKKYQVKWKMPCLVYQGGFVKTYKTLPCQSWCKRCKGEWTQQTSDNSMHFTCQADVKLWDEKLWKLLEEDRFQFVVDVQALYCKIN